MKRNKFSLSHYKLFTCDMGKLIPITWYEVLPGDTIQQSTSLLCRVKPLLAPVMHPVRVRIHHWFVPNRIIWDDWEDFITGGEDGLDASTHPYRNRTSCTESSLWDYFGLVPDAGFGTAPDLNALPLRAYQMIWNEHYRDQQLQTAATVDTSDGADTSTVTIQSVCWEKDYFTTCRTAEYLGDTVTIPLLGDAPVTGIGKPSATYLDTNVANVRETDGSPGTVTYAKASEFTGGTDERMYLEEDPSTAGYPNIRADLSAASGVDINDLRLAAALQAYQEARNLYGSRYSEYLKYLGVRPRDGRLQNPEYLGGGRQTIQFSEVLSSADSGTYDVGDLLGHGISAMRTNRFRRFIPEHGIIMTLLSVIPKSIYSQGLHRGFQRTTKEDYFQKELQFIGEQEVLNRELMVDHATPGGIFGYQSRYEEYRSHPSNIAGEFHSSLDHWHYARIFATDPALNSTFVTSTPTKRVNQDSGNDVLVCAANHSIQARRMISPVGKGRLL